MISGQWEASTWETNDIWEGLVIIQKCVIINLSRWTCIRNQKSLLINVDIVFGAMSFVLLDHYIRGGSMFLFPSAKLFSQLAHLHHGERKLTFFNKESSKVDQFFRWFPGLVKQSQNLLFAWKSTNQTPVFRTHDQSGPMRGQYSGHMISLDQSEGALAVSKLRQFHVSKGGSVEHAAHPSISSAAMGLRS